ncbi:MAG: D-amino-acid transaminase [Hyphomicrobium sp.]
MSRIVYVNGRYLPYAQAGAHVEDRGFQFADGVYEVCEVRGGSLVDEEPHMARLARSLAELAIPAPMSKAALSNVMRETVRRNRVRDGLLYLQVTRGVGPRDFAFPPPEVERTVVCIARPRALEALEAQAREGIAVKSLPDNRWGRSDIKTVMLLPACLAKEVARKEGAYEAWFIDSDGFVTEGASSNAWIVLDGGTVITRQIAPDILAGVTRATLIDGLAREGISLEERPFRLSEAQSAREAFITSATNTVMPVVRIDGVAIGNGRPGPITRQLRSKFHQFAEISAG